MIAALFLQALLGTLAPQQLPKTGCAAFLWNVSTRELVAVAGAMPASLRVQLDGKPIDLTRTAATGETVLGLPASTTFANGGFGATLELNVVPDPALVGGARVPSGLLTIERAGQDQLLVPIAGLIGCAEGTK